MMINPGQYDDLFCLIARDQQAHQFFSDLPEGVREAVSWRAKNVHSITGLQDYAQKLLSDYD